MTQTGNADYLRPMSEPYGVRVEDMLGYFSSYPLWVEVALALGVWMALAGAVLLLARSRLAAHAFTIALIGMLGTFAWSLRRPLPGATDGRIALGLSAMVAVLLLLQAIYCRAMAGRGVLR